MTWFKACEVWKVSWSELWYSTDPKIAKSLNQYWYGHTVITAKHPSVCWYNPTNTKLCSCEVKTKMTTGKTTNETAIAILKSLHHSKRTRKSNITTQRYTQIITDRYVRCVYLVFDFTMLLHWNWNNFAENSYFSRNRQNEKEISNACSQMCPNPSRKMQVQTL